jgi:hypothetical protein
MSLRSTLAVAAGLSLLAGSAIAAQADVEGQVLVRQNGKVQALAKGAMLKPGDQVIVGAGAAQIRYSPTCIVDLPANTVSTVTKAETCATTKGLVTPVSATPMQAQPTLGSTIIPFVIGGVTLAAVIASANDDDDFPVSP